MRNEEEAFKWFSRAAAQNLAEAQYNLAVCYKEGNGTPPDARRAIEWYQRAAAQVRRF